MRFGDSAPQEGRGVAVDSSGNVYIIGVFQGSIDFGGGTLTTAGANDVFVAKFDSAANHIWSKRFGDASNQFGLGIALDSSNNVLLTGYNPGTVNFGGSDIVAAGQFDVWVAKLDTNGNHIWSFGFASSDEQQGWSVARDASNNVDLTGYYRNTINFGGGDLPAAADWHAFLAKFNSSGAHQWSKGFGSAGAGQTFSRAVAVDGSANVYISGQFDTSVNFGGATLPTVGSRDAYIAKFDTNGTHVWSQRFGDTADQQGRRVAVDSAGNVFFHGYFQGVTNFGCGALTSAGGYDTFLAKFSSTGTCLFSNQYGDAGDQFGESLAIDTSNRVIAGGEFEATVNFGGGALTSGGNRDAFVAKFENTGGHVWSRRFGDAAAQRVGQSPPSPPQRSACMPLERSRGRPTLVAVL